MSDASDTLNKESKPKLNEQLKNIYEEGRERNTQDLAGNWGLTYIDLRRVNIDIPALGLIDENISKDANIVAFQINGKSLDVAILDFDNLKTKKILAELKDKEYNVTVYICSIASLAWAQKKYELVAKPREVIVDMVDVTNYSGIDFKDLGNRINDLDVENVSLIFGTLIKSAILVEASDIHIEAKEEEGIVKFRLDGVLFEVAHISKKVYVKIRDRIKLLARLKLNIQNSPQDGRFRITNDRNDYQARTSAIPAQYGEIIVIRILDQKKMGVSLSDLGLDPDEVKLVEGLTTSPNGMILVTGPTGSGKTTTLYSLLKKKTVAGINVITIEDPIEYQLVNVNQTQVDDSKGYSFSSGLKSILRQDPDVIMVGEIRDRDTADIATQASLTGHLVFSTLHTNEAAGTIARLLEFGLESDIISSSVKLAIAQRLVRKLCPYCKEEYAVTVELEKELKNALSILSPKCNMIMPKEIKKL